MNFTLNNAGTHYEQVIGFSDKKTEPASNGDNIELVYSGKDYSTKKFNFHVHTLLLLKSLKFAAIKSQLS